MASAAGTGSTVLCDKQTVFAQKTLQMARVHVAQTLFFLSNSEKCDQCFCLELEQGDMAEWNNGTVAGHGTLVATRQGL